MGLLLKLALLGVALYAAWKTLSRWKGLYDRFVGPPPKPPVPEKPPAPATAPPPSTAAAARQPVIEETVQCGGCGAYVSASAAKCGQCGRPLP
jgi:hypothetical protein